MSDPLHYETRDEVALLRLDDGKANALGHAMIDAISAGLDRAAAEARAAVLIGRPGRFSAGFDLGIIRGGPDAVRGLVVAGGELLMKAYLHPQPLVVACSGHAVAAGALLTLTGDTRIGAAGAYKIGLNEVAIGLRIPEFAVELARDRLSKRHLSAALLGATLYGPDDAVAAGYLDAVTQEAELEDTALAAASRLAVHETDIFADAKRRTRGALAERIRSGLEADVARVAGS